MLAEAGVKELEKRTGVAMENQGTELEKAAKELEESGALKDIEKAVSELKEGDLAGELEKAVRQLQNATEQTNK